MAEATTGAPKSPALLDRLRALSRTVREDVVSMITEAGSGHPGGSLSATDIIVTLYAAEMRFRAKEPRWPERDRFVLSKGHCVPALYSTMAEMGYFPREELLTLRQLGSRMQGHPANQILPGIEASTGSLGQGLSMALGMAMAQKLDYGDGPDAPRTYCMIGDGEMQEGQIWEAALSAPKFMVDNLCVFLDYNRAQIDGLVKDVLDVDPVDDKWRAFNWHVIRINGHDHEQILSALAEAKSVKGKPTFVVAHTIKGKGVQLFEKDLVKWHGVAPTRDELQGALANIRAGGDTVSWT